MLSIRTTLILPICLVLFLIVACALGPSAAPGTSPTLAPEVTRPEVTQPEVTQPEVTQPEVAATDVTAPPPTEASGVTALPQEGQAPNATVREQYSAPPPLTIDTAKTYTATLFTNKGELVLELFASEAPMTVNNFVFLAREGFYNGVTFHRIIRDFMVQAGDPDGDGTGGPGYRFADEPVTRAYTKGILAMANAGPNTNGSQFFIVHGADAGLPPSYTIFGEIASGVETLDAIAATRVRASSRGELSVPLEPIIIERIEIDESP